MNDIFQIELFLKDFAQIAEEPPRTLGPYSVIETGIGVGKFVELYPQSDPETGIDDLETIVARFRYGCRITKHDAT